MSPSVSDRRKLPAGSLALDHVAHYVQNVDEAARALESLGFSVTPPSVQTTHAPDGALVSAGTAFRSVMLDEGFLEVIAPVADTSRTRRMRERMAQYAGVHLACFGTAAANAEHERLARQGFDPLPLVEHAREVDLNGKAGVARYRVAHVRHGMMPEARIEYVEHLTPELLWQSRWLAHANGVTGLAALFVVGDDLPAVSARWARFSGLSPLAAGPFVRLQAGRGEVLIARRADWEAALGAAPSGPALAGYALACGDPALLRARLEALGRTVRQICGGVWGSLLPAALGGAWLFGTREALAGFLQSPDIPPRGRPVCEFKLVRTAELDEFGAILGRNGWRSEDFTVSEDVLDPATAEVEAKVGEVIVVCVRTHAVQQYPVGRGTSWVSGFDEDLRAGKFGRP